MPPAPACGAGGIPTSPRPPPVGEATTELPPSGRGLADGGLVEGRFTSLGQGLRDALRHEVAYTRQTQLARPPGGNAMTDYCGPIGKSAVKARRPSFRTPGAGARDFRRLLAFPGLFFGHSGIPCVHLRCAALFGVPIWASHHLVGTLGPGVPDRDERPAMTNAMAGLRRRASPGNGDRGRTRARLWEIVVINRHR
jgi:hypothetical protein